MFQLCIITIILCKVYLSTDVHYDILPPSYLYVLCRYYNEQISEGEKVILSTNYDDRKIEDAIRKSVSAMEDIDRVCCAPARLLLQLHCFYYLILFFLLELYSTFTLLKYILCFRLISCPWQN